MRVQQDDPGRRLRLRQAKPAMGLTALLLPVPVLVVAALVASMAAMGGFAGLEPLPLAALALVLAAFLIGASWWLLRLGRLPRSITLDRDAGTWVVDEASVLGTLQRTVSWPLDEIREVVLESNPRGRWREGVRPYLLLTLVRDNGERWPISFWIDDLEQRQELLDLAFRVAAITGHAAYRTSRNDPIGLGVTLVRAVGEGSEPVPAVEGAACYDRDEVGGEIAVPEMEVPPFDPAVFESAYRVEQWEPGTRVVLRRPFGMLALGCTGLFLAVFGALSALFLFGAVEAEGPERLIIGFIGLVGAVVVIGALANAVRGSLPRTVTVDWAARSIQVRGLLDTTEFPFDRLRELEVRGARQVRPASRGTSGGVYYRCVLVAHGDVRGRTGAQEVPLVDTLTTKGDAATPVRAARPLAAALAEAIGVPHRYTDYP